jgi:hypothetical protein
VYCTPPALQILLDIGWFLKEQDNPISSNNVVDRQATRQHKENKSSDVRRILFGRNKTSTPDDREENNDSSSSESAEGEAREPTTTNCNG